ncbi:MAG: Glu-tRNA(Gln) amidotransferase subunit GatD [Euryarchaeota archaeon]|nr:Glu-tRNA(Gln) amidotransferase subunit GatD [Euryarchaeota archaeon]
MKRVRVRKDGKGYEGIEIPSVNKAFFVLKLNNGYNMGFKRDEIEIEIIEEFKRETVPPEGSKIEHDKKLEDVSIIGTGGTIASKVDYTTGAVYPAFSPKELEKMVPEIFEVANIYPRETLQILSENMDVAKWKKIGQAVMEEIEKGRRIVIGHGTDTMHYTASFLSFALKNLHVPVILTGSQRSSDRPSSDSRMNLVCSVRFAITDYEGVVICMHGTMEDTFCNIYKGTKVRKNHTSRRDAFESINSRPTARVSPDGEIEFFEDLPPLNEGKTYFDDNIEEKVFLLKIFPGISSEILDSLIDNGYRGVVLEGTGLGHVPSSLYESIKRGVDEGVTFCMTSQCIYGRVNMNVYQTGRKLQDLGVIPCEDMLSEVCYTKMMHVLGHVEAPAEIRSMMRTNMAGEITEDTVIS